MRILRIVKFASLGVLLAALVVCGVTLSQSVRTRGDYDSGDRLTDLAGSSGQTKPSEDASSLPSSGSSGTSSGSSGTSSGSSGSASSSKNETEQKNETSSQTVTLQSYNFAHAKVAIPKEYADLLSVERVSDAYKTYNVMLRVYEKESKKQAERDLEESMGLLFEIGYVSAGNYDKFMDSGYYESRFFAKSDTKYYVYTTPSDVQFYRSQGEAGKDTWQKLQKLGGEVKDIFLRINDVERYEADAFREEPDTGGSGTPSGGDGTEMNGTTTPTLTGQDCAVCEGSGFCNHCVAGDCPTCYGKGKKDCTACLGRGRCWSCGGSGYIYKGTGLNFRKEDCSRCNGGDCNVCGGKGSTDCYSCVGGNCSVCDGTGDCAYCDGTGKRF